jgi:phosphoribosylformylglycinamidine (FGAM) synthase PurS component
MFEAQIKITLKKTVADPQGLTVKHALESLGKSSLKRIKDRKFKFRLKNAFSNYSPAPDTRAFSFF